MELAENTILSREGRGFHHRGMTGGHIKRSRHIGGESNRQGGRRRCTNGQWQSIGCGELLVVRYDEDVTPTGSKRLLHPRGQLYAPLETKRKRRRVAGTSKTPPNTYSTSYLRRRCWRPPWAIGGEQQWSALTCSSHRTVAEDDHMRGNSNM
ncbi:hypothetical protein CRG98_001072 [Punica granatum]|uniref:Uncharacterized protein n=1 Tax=Punica granatum TaxID=22663 RepID=A0A2I0LCW4_PUNGR|nr:hypothetical protein CRG98_001072 [Punica granatum]